MTSLFVLLDGGAIIRETFMPLDKIIVFVMAIAFFGFLIFLAIKTRQNAGKEGQPSSPPPCNSEEDSLPEQSRGKERRKFNR